MAKLSNEQVVRVPVRHHRHDLDAAQENKRKIHQMKKEGWEESNFTIDRNGTVTVWMQRRKEGA